MRVVPKRLLDDACAAYVRATGTSPNRAGLRAALHQVGQDLPETEKQRLEEMLNGPYVCPHCETRTFGEKRFWGLRCTVCDTALEVE